MRGPTNVGAETVKEVEPLTTPRLALMTVDPVVKVLARPCEPFVFEMMATLEADDAQVTCVDKSCVEPSVYEPMAKYVRVKPNATVDALGVTEIATKLAGTTVRVAAPMTAPTVARIEVTPGLMVEARPREPAVFEIIAAEVFDEDQVRSGELVRIWVLESL
jgi:hypothetical protein